MNKPIETKLALVITKLIHLESDQALEAEFASYSQKEAEKKGFFTRDFGMAEWDWPQGVGIFGLKRSGSQYDDYIRKWAHTEIAKGLPEKNINTICPLQTLMEFDEFGTLAEEWMAWLAVEAPRTRELGLQHTTTGVDKSLIKMNDQQIWIDTIFMTVLFMAKMGVKHDNVKWRQEATYQVLLHSKYLLDRESSLFYHGWNYQNQSNYGGNFWCRGNSWFTMGLPLFIEIMTPYLEEEVLTYFTHLYRNQVDSLLSLRNQDGLWHTLLDDDGSYTETSGSAGIVTGMAIGLKLGLLDQSYEKACQESLLAIIERIDEEGVVHGVSAGTAISEAKEDYKAIIKSPMAYGQAMVICALSEFLDYRQQ